MKDFFGWLNAWVILVFGPVLATTALISFILMDLSVFNPSNWHILLRSVVSIWVVIGTLVVIGTVVDQKRSRP